MDFTTSAPFSEQSLPNLPSHLQNDTQLTAHLASRFHAHYPTARLSSQALIALNTYTSASKGPNGDVEESAMGATKELASRAWARLGHRGENQAMVFLGESGSGKTTLRAHLLMNVLAFSSTPLSEKVSLASYVFDTLTTTKTATTQTASKAGLFLELQYDTSATMHPTLIGGKLLDHRLERSRVATVPTGERNFHMFYYLLAGTSPAEKQHLGLDAASTAADVSNRVSMAGKRWRYLGHPTQLKVGVNDAQGFQDWKTALRKLGFSTHEIADICQVLATILHLGQLDFHETTSTTPAADDSGGYSHEGGEKVTLVKNKEELDYVSAFLGISTSDLERSLANKTTTSRRGRDRIGVMLDSTGARANADELARTLYSLLVAYVVEQMNDKLCAPENSVANTISIVDFPGFAYQSATGHTLDQLLNNAANEALHNFCVDSFFEHQSDMLEEEDVAIPQTEYYDNSAVTKALLKPSNGLLTIIDDQQRRGKDEHGLNETLEHRFKDRDGPINVSDAKVVAPGTNFTQPNAAAWFKVKHFAGDITYAMDGLMDQNAEVVSGDMVNLIRTTHNDFVRDLFGQDALKTVSHPQEQTAVVQATISSKPARQPSMSRKKYQALQRSATKRKVFGEDADAISTSSDDTKQKRSKASAPQQGASAQYLTSLTNITKALNAPNTNPYFIFCLKPNDRRVPNQFDSKCVRTQMQTYCIPEISQRLKIADFSVFLPFSEFLGLAEGETVIVGSEREKAEMILDERRWPQNEARAGTTGVFLSERVWLEIADFSSLPQAGHSNHYARGAAPSYDDGNYLSPGMADKSSGSANVRLMDGQTPSPGAFYNDVKGAEYFGSKEIDMRSDAGASAMNGDMFRGMETKEQMGEKSQEAKMQAVEEHPVSGSRKRWLTLVYLLTWYIPDFGIRLVGRMPRKDVRIAWREKLAINLLIWLSCAFVVFFMIGLPELICPTQHVYSQAELSSYDGKGKHDSFVAMRGIVYDLGAFMPSHYPSIVPQSALKKYAGTDATNLFPVQVSALCNGIDGKGIDNAVQLDYKNSNYTNTNTLISTSDTNAQYHDFRWFRNDSRFDWWWEQQIMLKANYMKGRIGFSPEYLKTLAGKQNSIAILYDRVYDLTNYNIGGRTPQYPAGTSKPSTPPNSNFMDPLVVSLFTDRAGQDVSKYWENLHLQDKSSMKTCLDNLFYVGDVDTRNSSRCLFAKYILLAISILLVSVIGFKFLAALQFGKKNMPENLDKFVICTVPAYTEDEESLRRAIDSISRMRYDDKRKLLVVICDGMIVGQGNDRPTPRIVLDILGVSETVDPEPLSFESLGEGQKQHNMGKVYSGLYEVQGHIVPYLVVVKVGKPSEVSKPGNRGKRDSQMILMRFLNRVHYNLPMTPLELEMHHQIRNIIGVNPTFYEFLFQIDADTVVAQDSATRMIAQFLHDTRLIGVCGETALTNAKASFITMMQVYEYYISHNLTKAFESLFGSVTCLPGCFSMYRIRAAETGKPLFVSKEIVEAYSEIRVDTLHMKNLLHLGEDRYLTTLLLKFHSKYKTKYIFRAHAWTIAPDSWTVFMSQRRRWINSTVHNLIELIPIQQLCGFCCFSMRFVVFLDLLSTIVQPVIVGYIIYLIVLIARDSTVVPIFAFVLLGAIYGLQAIIFILRRKWEMIGWMLIYVVATPIFAFGLPLYAFWHMDDFSWGNTRVVTGEKGQKVIVSDEGKFDPDSIPKMKWEQYQNQLWEAQTSHMPDDTRSEMSGISYGTRSYGQGPFANGTRTPSDFGGAHSRSGSAMDLHRLGSGSRLSLAHSQFGNAGMGWNNGSGEMNLEMHDMLPSDDALLAEIKQILATADLMTVTKKSVKQELERRFGMPLEAKRAYIGSATEAVLAGNL